MKSKHSRGSVPSAGTVRRLAVTVALGLAVAAGAADPPPVDDLGLTADQKARTLEILQARRPILREAIKASTAARRDLVRATQTDPPDEAAVRAAARKSAAAEEELAVQRARLTGALREILTPAQKRRLARAQEDVLTALDSRAQREGALLDAWIQDYGPAAEAKK